MLFNSYGYLFVFLPLALAGYFALSRHSIIALGWLVAVSLIFYAWWNPWHLPLALGSIGFNYWTGRRIMTSPENRRHWLWLGITANLLLLGVFKYTQFALGLVADLTHWQMVIPQIALPLGISFFTFTQIAYLVDTARGTVRETNPVHYALFVTFFPHLLAGPILHHAEMMPQFADAANRSFNASNFARGLFLLALGFGKKVLVADPLGAAASSGYAAIDSLGLLDAWQTTLAYTFQIYFDFGGYTDMALGAALMFNIRLPVNFNSPYLATNIQDFWRRWHITLSRFLRDYLYVPLGGNRAGAMRVAGNIMATFLLGGLWHGAGWTFIAWGGLHGAALVTYRWWQRTGLHLPKIAAVLLTFFFVHLTWVFFRARTITDALHMLRKLVPDEVSWATGFWPLQASIGLPYAAPSIGILLLLAVCLTSMPTNSDRLAGQFSCGARDCIWAGVLLTLGTLTLGQVTQFLYFNF